MNILKMLFGSRKPALNKPDVMRSKPTCERCGSRDVNVGHYTRGYNELCKQACGDRGWFCNKCYRVTFEKTLEKYKETLPNWCRAYG